jgi:hypothetical protein
MLDLMIVHRLLGIQKLNTDRIFINSQVNANAEVFISLFILINKSLYCVINRELDVNISALEF